MRHTILDHKRLVILESPFKGNELHNEAANIHYAKRCLLHSIRRGEAPIASHLLHPQILRDADAEERKLGIEAGIAWYRVCDLVVFYIDHGWSGGMLEARKIVEGFEIPSEERSIENL
jgi:hypothetical protein